MLASVALLASGGDRYLQSAGGLSQALEQRLAARLPQPEQKTSLQPIAAPQPSRAAKRADTTPPWRLICSPVVAS